MSRKKFIIVLTLSLIALFVLVILNICKTYDIEYTPSAIYKAFKSYFNKQEAVEDDIIINNDKEIKEKVKEEVKE